MKDQDVTGDTLHKALKAIVDGPYNDPDEGPIVRLEKCGHWVPSKTMRTDLLPKRMRCVRCLEARRSTPG